MRMKTIIKFGLATLAMGTFFGVGLPVKAGELVWVRAQPIDFWRARGLMPPGSYSHNENEKPATIAVNKAGQGVGEQKQTAHKAAKKNMQNIRSAKKDT